MVKRIPRIFLRSRYTCVNLIRKAKLSLEPTLKRFKFSLGTRSIFRIRKKGLYFWSWQNGAQGKMPIQCTIGQFPFSIYKINPFFTSNFQKWIFVPSLSTVQYAIEKPILKTGRGRDSTPFRAHCACNEDLMTKRTFHFICQSAEVKCNLY